MKRLTEQGADSFYREPPILIPELPQEILSILHEETYNRCGVIPHGL